MRPAVHPIIVEAVRGGEQGRKAGRSQGCDVTSKIISLRGERKRRARAEKRAQGNANAAKFGRTKTEKDFARAKAAKAERDLDAHRIEGTESDRPEIDGPDGERRDPE